MKMTEVSKTRFQPYPVANWREKSHYSESITERAKKAAGVKTFENFRGQFSEDDLRNERDIAQLWRWEFLRRLPDYQKDFFENVDSKIIEEKYGVMWTSRPQPDQLCPPDLRFFDLNRNRKLNMIDFRVDLREQISDTMSNIPARIRHIRKQLGIEAEQLPARKKWPQYLRVLDALLSGESNAEIGRVLSKGSANPSAAGKRLVEQATRAQRIMCNLA
jgi:hypothetical protein